MPRTSVRWVANDERRARLETELQRILEAEYRAVAATVDRMTRDGVVLLSREADL